jgi:anti-sigma B factor antagonist
MQPSFDIALVETEASLRLVLTGELDIATAPLVDAALDQAEAGSTPQILLDLAAVPFIDSSGLRTLIRAADRAAANGGRIAIAGAGPQARRLFELSGAGTRLPILD